MNKRVVLLMALVTFAAINSVFCSTPPKKLPQAITTQEELTKYEEEEHLFFKEIKIAPQDLAPLTDLIVSYFDITFFSVLKYLFIERYNREPIALNALIYKIHTTLPSLREKIKQYEAFNFIYQLKKKLLNKTGANFHDYIRLIWTTTIWQTSYLDCLKQIEIKRLQSNSSIQNLFITPPNVPLKNLDLPFPSITTSILCGPLFELNKGLTITTQNSSFEEELFLESVTSHQQSNQVKSVEKILLTSGTSFFEHAAEHLGIYNVCFKVIKELIEETKDLKENDKERCLNKINKCLQIISLRSLLVTSPETQKFFEESSSIRALLTNKKIALNDLEESVKKITAQPFIHLFEIITHDFPKKTVFLPIDFFTELFCAVAQGITTKNEALITNKKTQPPATTFHMTVRQHQALTLSNGKKHVLKNEVSNSKVIEPSITLTNIIYEKEDTTVGVIVESQRPKLDYFTSSNNLNPPIEVSTPKPTKSNGVGHLLKLEKYLSKVLFKKNPENFITLPKKYVPPIIFMLIDKNPDSFSTNALFSFSFTGADLSDVAPEHFNAIQSNKKFENTEPFDKYKLCELYEYHYCYGALSIIVKDQKADPSFFVLAIPKAYPLPQLMSTKLSAIQNIYKLERELESHFSTLLEKEKLKTREIGIFMRMLSKKVGLFFALSIFRQLNKKTATSSQKQEELAKLLNLVKISEKRPEDPSSQTPAGAGIKPPKELSQKTLEIWQNLQSYCPHNVAFLDDFKPLLELNSTDPTVKLRTHAGFLRKLEQQLFEEIHFKYGKESLSACYEQLFKELLNQKITCFLPLKEISLKLQKKFNFESPFIFLPTTRYEERIMELQKIISTCTKQGLKMRYHDPKETEDPMAMINKKINDPELQQKIKEAQNSEKTVTETLRYLGILTTYWWDDLPTILLTKGPQWLTYQKALLHALLKKYPEELHGNECLRLLSMRDIMLLDHPDAAMIEKTLEEIPFLKRWIAQSLFNKKRPFSPQAFKETLRPFAEMLSKQKGYQIPKNFLESPKKFQKESGLNG